jgi:hypothetical protein
MTIVLSEVVQALASEVEDEIFNKARQGVRLRLPAGLAHEVLEVHIADWRGTRVLTATLQSVGHLPKILLSEKLRGMTPAFRKVGLISELSSFLEVDWPVETRLLENLKSHQVIDLLRSLEASAPASIATVEVSIKSVSADVLEALNRDPDLVYSLEPRAFEELVATLFEKEGFVVNLTKRTRDGGFDIEASKSSVLGSELFLVECKRYSPQRLVGIEIVQRLHGVARERDATRGIVATTSFFSDPAKNFARSQRFQMALLDYHAIAALLRRQATGEKMH